MSPSSAPTFISDEVLAAAAKLSGYNVLADTTSPQYQVVGWMSTVDQMNIGGSSFPNGMHLLACSLVGRDWINQEQ